MSEPAVNLKEIEKEVEHYGKDHWLANKIYTHIDHPRHKLRLDTILDHVEGSSFLDIACATGEITEAVRLKLNPSRIVGYEGSPSVVDKARAWHPEIEFIQGIVQKLPFRRNEFDCVFAGEIIEHVHEPETFVKRLAKITSKRLILSTPDDYVEDPGHVLLYTEAGLREVCEKYFNKVKIIHIPRTFIAVCDEPKPETVKVIITTYNRPDLLTNLLKKLAAAQSESELLVSVDIYDDASTMSLKKVKKVISRLGLPTKLFRNGKNRGKKEFYKTFSDIFANEKKHSFDYYLVIQDDVEELCRGFFKRLIDAWEAIDDDDKVALNYCCPKSRIDKAIWNQSHEPKTVFFNNKAFRHLQWVDGFFFCERRLFEKLEFKIEPVSKTRWDRNPLLGSGVFPQVSNRLHSLNLNMYAFSKSFIKSSHAPSVMNPKERELNPEHECPFIDG